MEHAKKMFLINPEILQKMQESADIGPKTLSQLDAEMQTVLKSKINEHEKWTRYQQVLQRFLHFSNNVRDPVKSLKSEPQEQNIQSVSTVDEEPLSPVTSKSLNLDDIIETIPKNLRKKTTSLLQHISRNENIKWDKNGLVSINDQLLKDSNIVDIINDIVRVRKPLNKKPTEAFLDGMKEINLPVEYIGNEAYRDYYLKNRSVPSTPQAFSFGENSDFDNTVRKLLSKSYHSTPYPESLSDAETSQSKKRRNRRRRSDLLRKLDWEPY